MILTDPEFCDAVEPYD